MNIGYYGELDPFSGSVRQRRDDLGGLIADLGLMCLFYDLVIVPPGCLFEHGLALPAFEALAPLVRAGRLGTTEDQSCKTPRAFVDGRAALYLGARSSRDPLRRRPKPTERRRRRDIESTKRRWLDLLPEQWTISRDVSAQVHGFAEQLLFFCDHDAEQHAPSAGPKIREAVDRLLQAGQSPDRTTLFAHAAALRGHIPPRELSLASLMLQSAYFSMGASAHARPPQSGLPAQTCLLFPGRLGALLRESAAELPSSSLPPYDWDHHPSRLRERLQRIGVEADALTRLRANDLLEITRSPEWASVRASLRNTEPPHEIERSVRSVFARFRDIRDALPLVAPLLAPPPLPMLLPAPWQLAVQAVLGAHLPDKDPHANEDIVLDLNTLSLTDPRSGVNGRLTLQQAYLVTLLIISGDIGLRLHDVKQLTMETDALSATAMLPAWKSQTGESSELDEARLDRAYVLKTRTNQALATFGVAIEAAADQWVMSSSQHRTIKLGGTIWDLLLAEPSREPPELLSPQLAAVWNVLVSASPQCLKLHAVAAHLTGRADCQSLSQAARSVYKLERALTGSDVPWRLVRPQRGLVGLLPRLTAGDKECWVR